jgi:Tol biopolymer transport system component
LIAPINAASVKDVADTVVVPRIRNNWFWPVLALLFVVCATGIWGVMTRPRLESTSRWARVTADAGLTTDPAISPDGKLLAYSSDRAGGSLDIWVQQLAEGGQAIRITSGDADEHEPAFSSDGSKIVFRSEQNGGGVYIVASLGGQPKMLAPLGRNPRFSPDGLWVSYWKGDFIGSALGAGHGESSIFVVPVGGGTPRELPTGLAEASHPVWSPDGRHILVYGSRAPFAQLPLGPLRAAADWWVVPMNGGAAAPTGAFRYFEKQGLATTSPFEIPRPGYWLKEGVVFFARMGDTVNLWRIPLSLRDLRVSGAAHRITSGTAIDAHPSQSQNGRLAFAGLSLQVNLWVLPMDIKKGSAKGPIRRLTQGVVSDTNPSLCPDGSRVVFNSNRPGSAKPGIWIRELDSGRERLLAQGEGEPFHPQISSDCTTVAYTQNDGDYVIPSGGGLPAKICSDCSVIWDWSRDQTRLLFSKRGQLSTISLLDLSIKSDRIILKGQDETLYQARFSPDEAWVTFLRARRGLWISPLPDGLPTNQGEWFAITEDGSKSDKPRWSPDGNIVYYTSDRDGFWCLWGQHLSLTSKRPVGRPFPVYHFHSRRLSVASVARGEQEIAVGKEMIVLNIGETTGNLWVSRE